MVYLLDTCILIKALVDPEKIDKRVLEKLLNQHNQLYVSTASLWEITIKNNKHPDLVPFSGEDVMKKLTKKNMI